MASCGWEPIAPTRAKYAVRPVTFRQGNTLRRYITNVREPHAFPIASMAEVYARRWDIEMALALIKQHLELRLLWSAKRVVISWNRWSHRRAYSVILALSRNPVPGHCRRACPALDCGLQEPW